MVGGHPSRPIGPKASNQVMLPEQPQACEPSIEARGSQDADAHSSKPLLAINGLGPGHGAAHIGKELKPTHNLKARGRALYQPRHWLRPIKAIYLLTNAWARRLTPPGRDRVYWALGEGEGGGDLLVHKFFAWMISQGVPKPIVQ